MNELLLNYGVLGIAVIGLTSFIMFLFKQHKEERAEWRRDVVEQQEKVKDSVNNNTIVMEKIKTLIESKN